MKRLRLKTNPVVFGVSVLVILVFLIVGITASEAMGRAFDAVQSGIASTLGWYYILVVTGFLVFVIWLGASRFGRIRLGPPDSRPEYRYLTWFAMLFTAGMGIGLVFWSVAEPLQHLAESPTGGAGTDAEAMRFTFFHWGLHAWAIYIVVGVSLAYFAYRHNLPLSIRSALYPLLGDRIHGRLGDLVDVFAVFGTMFGVATSLGFGILQVNAGLASLGILQQSLTVQLVLIAAITLAAIASLLAGLDKGILRLSVTNLVIGVVLMLFVLFTGPTTIEVLAGLDKGILRLSVTNLVLGVVLMLFVLFTGPTTIEVLASFVQQTGHYVQLLPETSLWTGSPEWQSANTIFYWGWWISWSPFVGMFIARVSRGRTIREFVFGVLLVPVTLTFLWMAVFGNTAFEVDRRTDGELSAAAAEGPETALFSLLDALPLTAIMTVLAILLVATYFVTSSDSASLVIDMLTSGGRTDAPKIQKVFWASLEGGIAAVLLMAGAGGLAALQTAAVTTALPFSIIMVVMCYGLVRALYADDHRLPLDRVTLREAAHQPVPERVDARRSPFRDRVQGSP